MNQTKKFLSFKITGDFGFFKKPEITTSPISYYFPPRTTIIGMIAAILGEGKDTYHDLELFNDDNCEIAIKINEKINTFFYNTNTVEFSNSLITNRAPTNYTYLKKPNYTIFIYLNKKYDELKKRLKEKDFVYNVSLGLANLLAKVSDVIEIIFDEVPNKDNTLKVSTVVPFKKGKDGLIKNISEYSGEILKTNIPRLMNCRREVTEFCSYIYERNGEPITILAEKELKLYLTKDSGEIIAIM